jgi:hypothetical protein
MLRRWPRRALCFELIEPCALLGRENFPHLALDLFVHASHLGEALGQSRVELGPVALEDCIRFLALLGGQAELAQRQMSEAGGRGRTVPQITLRPEREPNPAGTTEGKCADQEQRRQQPDAARSALAPHAGFVRHQRDPSSTESMRPTDGVSSPGAHRDSADAALSPCATSRAVVGSRRAEPSPTRGLPSTGALRPQRV